MSEATRSRSWRDEFASLVEDTGIRYPDGGVDDTVVESRKTNDLFGFSEGFEVEEVESESFKDQIKGFLDASAEMIMELGRGCRDIVIQSMGKEDSFISRKVVGPLGKASSRLRFLNEFLPEDRDPVHAWTVVLIVFVIAFAALSVNSEHQSSVPPMKEMYIPRPPSASRVLLPDGRQMAYREQGVPAERARFSLIAPHSFLSSRLAGIPGIKASLLEEFGVRLLTYDLPGFGESDPHPHRDLNSSALDISYIADAVGVKNKFWMVGYSGAGMHAWAAIRYIPDRLAGAAMFAPMGNPFESSMSKEERQKTWEKWTLRRKFMFHLAKKFPSFLAYFYRRSFLSRKRGQPDQWLSLSLGKKDRALIEEPIFNEFWKDDVWESIRQGDPNPFVEEARLLVSNWGFSLGDLQVHKNSQGKGLLVWLKSMYTRAERERAGFLGPIHIWQGTDDRVVPPLMIDFVRRVVPGVTVHRLPGEGHFSYFCFCDQCHKDIFFNLFGSPQGPLNATVEDLATVEDQTTAELTKTPLIYIGQD